MKMLIVVGMQNDFISGSLANKDAENCIEYINKKIASFRKNKNDILFVRSSYFKNYADTLEGKHLPIEHCIYGSEGWEISKEIDYDAGKDTVIDSKQIGFNSWSSYLKNVDEVYIVGTRSDTHIISNAAIIKATRPNIEVNVFAKGCAGTTTAEHEAAISTMKSCQVNVIED